MTISNFRRVAPLFLLAVFALSAFTSRDVRAEAPAVDPAATQSLQRMTDYLGGSAAVQRAHARTPIEDLLDSGHRVDFDVSANVTVSRPDKLCAERTGDLVEQDFLLRWQDTDAVRSVRKVYATEPAPGTIEEMLNFARESLGLVIPAADLVYRNAYQLLMQDVTSGDRGRQGGDRRGQVRSSGLQPPGCRLSGMGRRKRPAAAVQICRHRHQHPRADERHQRS